MAAVVKLVRTPIARLAARAMVPFIVVVSAIERLSAAWALLRELVVIRFASATEPNTAVPSVCCIMGTVTCAMTGSRLLRYV